MKGFQMHLFVHRAPAPVFFFILILCMHIYIHVCAL